MEDSKPDTRGCCAQNTITALLSHQRRTKRSQCTGITRESGTNIGLIPALDVYSVVYFPWESVKWPRITIGVAARAAIRAVQDAHEVNTLSTVTNLMRFAMTVADDLAKVGANREATTRVAADLAAAANHIMIVATVPRFVSRRGVAAMVKKIVKDACMLVVATKSTVKVARHDARVATKNGMILPLVVVLRKILMAHLRRSCDCCCWFLLL